MTTLFMYLLIYLIGKFTLKDVDYDCYKYHKDR